MKTWIKVTLGIIGFIIIVGIIGSLSDSNNSSSTGSSITLTEKGEPLTILSHNDEYNEYGNLIITGLAKNTGNKDLSYAQIDVKFYDEDGNVISNSFDNVNDLKKGETWKFEVMYIGLDIDNVDGYKISVGSAW